MITRLLVMLLCLTCSHFLSLGRNISLSAPFLDNLNLCSSFRTRNRYHYNFYIQIFTFKKEDDRFSAEW
jgi:hypothetical protein